MKLLSSSTRSINPLQKRRLYRCCTLPITLYGFLLWYYNKAPTCYHLNILRKMWWRATLWITGAFCTLPILGTEAIARLVSIHLHLKKLYGRFLLQQTSLLSNYITHSILSSYRLQEQNCHNASIDHLMAKQRIQLKLPLINVDNKCNKFFPSFSFFNEEFKLGNHLVDIFPDHFSFHSCLSNIKKHIKNLNEITFRVSSDPFSTIIVSDTSIKNQVATFISHIHSFNKPIIKTLHRAINITTVEAKLFAIWCGINQAVTNSNTNHIVVITDSLHIARKIFNSSAYPYQIYSAAIFMELREFFSKDSRNCIKFWDCPSKQQWSLHHTVDKEIKNIVSILLFPCRSSWDFCKKSECNCILSQWRMIFQVSDSKGRNFLDLLDDNLNPIEPSSSKGSLWLSQFDHSNLLCTQASRAITNCAPIGEFQLKFFSRERFDCPCSFYPIKTRCYILHECHRFNNYWNPRRNTLAHFVLFLQFNPSTFLFT